MIDKIFSITGNKIASLLVDENSLKFSSSTSFVSAEEFREAFAKKLSFATKLEIKYDSIRSIRKEDNDNDVYIKYKTFAGITGTCVFSFTEDDDDYQTFFNFFEKERYYSKRQETSAPLKAATNYLIWLLITILLSVFCYYEAIAIANGTVEPATSGKTRAFNYVVGLLGDKGVIALGSLVSCYLVYKAWSRFSNPPNQLVLLPPGSFVSQDDRKDA